ncbi:MAG: DsbA family protein [Pseudomonadota bacterium]
MLDRRTFNVAGFAALSSLPFTAHAAFAQDFDMAKLLELGPLPEKSLGDPAAPVTMIEYASATCGFCARFHKQTFPALKERYIETGKVHFISREFPLDALAAAAFMLARCVPDDKYFDFLDIVYETQTTWSRSDKPVDALFALAQQGGLTRSEFDACLKNQDLLEGINWTRQRAETEFGVRSTPTFFVNGELVRGAVTIDELDRIIEQHL